MIAITIMINSKMEAFNEKVFILPRTNEVVIINANSYIVTGVVHNFDKRAIMVYVEPQNTLK